MNNSTNILVYRGYIMQYVSNLHLNVMVYFKSFFKILVVGNLQTILGVYFKLFLIWYKCVI
jgi:hypothetical protein